MQTRSSAITTVLLTGCCLLCAAGTGAADGDENRTLIEQVREEDEQRETRWAGFHRIRAGYPQTISAGLGVIRARLPQSWECVTACPFRGLVLQAEPGLGGIQLGAGFATLVAEKRHNKSFLADIHVGFGVKGVLFHDWNDGDLTAAERTYAGVEFGITVTRINISICTMRRIDRVPGDDWIVSAGMGWGF